MRRSLQVLILCAQVGESHLVMARTAGEQLEAQPQVRDVEIINDFNVLGRSLGGYLRTSFKLHLGRLQWSYDLAYSVFAKSSLGRIAGEQALSLLGAKALLQTIEAKRPDLVVSTYPVMNPILGALRAQNRISCPVAAVVGPAAGLAYWVHRGIDLHLLNYHSARDELRRLAPQARAEAVRPLVRSEFFEPALDREQARASLALPAKERIVLVSGGGWGAGDLLGAVDACLAVPDVHVVVLAGRNDAVHRLLSQRFASQRRVRLLAFSDQMRALLTAADVFIAATAGLSCIEAHLCGCPTICYGFSIGHVRDNTMALQALGRATVASNVRQLPDRIEAELERGRPQPPPPPHLPTAADLLIPLALSSTTRRG